MPKSGTNLTPPTQKSIFRLVPHFNGAGHKSCMSPPRPAKFITHAYRSGVESQFSKRVLRVIFIQPGPSFASFAMLGKLGWCIQCLPTWMIHSMRYSCAIASLQLTTCSSIPGSTYCTQATRTTQHCNDFCFFSLTFFRMTFLFQIIDLDYMDC